MLKYFQTTGLVTINHANTVNKEKQFFQYVLADFQDCLNCLNIIRL